MKSMEKITKGIFKVLQVVFLDLFLLGMFTREKSKTYRRRR